MQEINEIPLPVQGGADIKLRVGDTIRWSNPLGIGGVTLDARVTALRSLGHDPLSRAYVAMLDVSPNEQLRECVSRMADFAKPSYPNCPAAHGNGGPLFVTYDTLWRDAANGVVRCYEVGFGTMTDTILTWLFTALFCAMFIGATIDDWRRH